jgi:hypothetical protein
MSSNLCDKHSDFIASCELESSPAISRSAVLIGCFSSTIDSKHELNPSLWKTHTDVLGRKVPIVCEIRYSTSCQSSPNSQSCCASSVRISKVIHLSLFTEFLPIMMAIVYDRNENMEAIGALFSIII